MQTQRKWFASKDHYDPESAVQYCVCLSCRFNIQEKAFSENQHHGSRQKIEWDTRLKAYNSNRLHHSANDGAVSSPELSAEKITMQKYTECCSTLNHKGGQS